MVERVRGAKELGAPGLECARAIEMTQRIRFDTGMEREKDK